MAWRLEEACCGNNCQGKQCCQARIIVGFLKEDCWVELSKQVSRRHGTGMRSMLAKLFIVFPLELQWNASLEATSAIDTAETTALSIRYIVGSGAYHHAIQSGMAAFNLTTMAVISSRTAVG